MAYRLKLGEPVPEGIGRIAREEIEGAVRQLTGKGDGDRDAAIHESRKHLKKIRGVLRLMRPELGESYRRENTFFREVSRQLSQFRDAGATIESYDALREKYRGELARGRLSSIRRALIARKRQAEKHGGIENVLHRIAAALRQSARRVETWPLATEGFEAIEPGLHAAFRRGQKAMARARKHPLPENYHEWRKRAKDHWYHVRLLEGYWDGTMPAYERRLKDLETWLGEDHNLAVLREKVMAEPGFYGGETEIGLFVRLVGKYRKELRGNALESGAGIYDEKPGHFTRRIRRQWDKPVGLAPLPGHNKNGRPKAAVLRLSKMPDPSITAGSENQSGGPTGVRAARRGAPQ